MKEGKKSNQQIYKIRLYKEFSFPSFSIDKNNTLADVTHRALEELKDNLQNPEYFQVEITNILPFTLKSDFQESTGNMDYDFFVRELAINDTKERYGELDYDKNPKIFEKGNQTQSSVTYNVLPEVEDFFVKKLKKYISLFDCKKIER